MRAHLLTVSALALVASLTSASAAPSPAVDLSDQAFATVNGALTLLDTTQPLAPKQAADNEAAFLALFAPRVVDHSGAPSPGWDFAENLLWSGRNEVPARYVLTKPQVICDNAHLTCTVSGDMQLRWQTLPWENISRSWVIVFTRTTAPLGLIAEWK